MRYLFLVVLIASCGNGVTNPTRDATLFIQTDKLEYKLTDQSGGRAFSVSYVYTNALTDTLYIVNCNNTFGYSLQRYENNSWVTIWSPPVPLCLSQPIVIPPGGKYSGQFDIWGAAPGSNTFPRWPSGDLTGNYRLLFGEVVMHYTDRGQSFGEQPAENARASNEFRLED